jgi:hypothetical protein
VHQRGIAPHHTASSSSSARARRLSPSGLADRRDDRPAVPQPLELKPGQSTDTARRAPLATQLRWVSCCDAPG